MKLKPCPFCGGKARVTGSFEVYGECRECGAEGEHFYVRPIYGDSEKAAKKKASEAWNRRVDGKENEDV